MKQSLIFFLMLIAFPCKSQSVTNDINIVIPSKEFDEQTIFHLNNINGEVSIQGYSGNEIIVSGTKTIWRKNSKVLSGDIDNVTLKQHTKGDHFFLYVDAPDLNIEFENGMLHYESNCDQYFDKYEDELHNEVDELLYDELQYEVVLNLQLPEKLKTYVSTINGGSVFAANMHQFIKASNVNGDIHLKDMHGIAHAKTVNGDIIVDFVQNPLSDVSFKTVNGSIEIFAPKNLSAVVTFQSFHGELYTDFEEIKILPNEVMKSVSEGKNNFKINKAKPIRFGKGGPGIKLVLLNGNAYIKKRTL